MKYIDLISQIKRPYFTRQDLRLNNLSVFNYQLTFWTKKDYIQPLKRGVYYFVDRKNDLIPQEISHLIYEPSYISLESALSFYGLIPEIVNSQTAVTSKITRKFSNDFGHFIYRHLKPRLFFGYNSIKTKFGRYLLADPEKALLDFIYLNLDKIINDDDINELRINYEILNQIVNQQKLLQYLTIFQNKKLKKIINLIQKQCKLMNS